MHRGGRACAVGAFASFQHVALDFDAQELADAMLFGDLLGGRLSVFDALQRGLPLLALSEFDNVCLCAFEAVAQRVLLTFGKAQLRRTRRRSSHLTVLPEESWPLRPTVVSKPTAIRSSGVGAASSPDNG